MLVEFLLARIEEDEWAAGDIHHAACERNWTHGADCSCRRPARVMAECEAKRRIIEGFTRALVNEGHPSDRLPDVDVFRSLALPHADHPDYDRAWHI